jgi:hypothetical protein
LHASIWWNYIEYMLLRNMAKCNCHRLKYLVLYHKRVIALILRNIIYTKKSSWNTWYYIIINTIYVGYVSDAIIPLSVNVVMGSHGLQHTCTNKVGLINNVQFKYVSIKIYGHTSKKNLSEINWPSVQKLLALPEHLTSPQICNIAFSTH